MLGAGSLASRPALAQAAQARRAFKIEFDYRFDELGFFKDPQRRHTLELAARTWGQILGDDFPTVKAPRTFKFTHPVTDKEHTYPLTRDIDDLLILIFTSQQNGSSKASGGPLEHHVRKVGKYQPFLGKLTFNTTSSRAWFFDQTPETSWDIPSTTHHDLYSTALHEIGHILGFLVPVYKDTGNWSDDTFTGANARRFNLGRPIPLGHDSSHISRAITTGLPRPFFDEYLMTAVSPMQGFRFVPRPLAAAMLADMGYTVSLEGLPRIDDVLHGPNPQQAAYLAKHPKATQDPSYPVALWQFDHAEYYKGAILGAPVKPVPRRAFTGAPGWRIQDGAMILDKDAYIIAEHPLRSTAKAGAGRYSLLMDVALADPAGTYGLFNANFKNENDAEVLVKGGVLAARDSTAKTALKAGEWHRIVITADNTTLRVYADGAFVLETAVTAASMLDSLDQSQPFVAFFCNGPQGPHGTVTVSKLAIYAYPLSAEQILRLGKPQQEVTF